MNMKFNVTSNKIVRVDENITTAGSVVFAEFFFTSDWYSAARRTAVFKCNGQSYYSVLDAQNICRVPSYCLQDDVQSFSVSVFSNIGTTTNLVDVLVTSNYLDQIEPNTDYLVDNIEDLNLCMANGLQDRKILNTIDNTVLVYSIENEAWEVDPSVTPTDIVLVDSFTYNEITKKLFQNTGTEFLNYVI